MKRKKMNIKQVEARLKADVNKAKLQIAKAKKQAMDAEKKMISMAKKDPKKALAIAAGAGAVLGAVAATLMRRKR